MSKKSVSCPVCGSTEVKRIERLNVDILTLGEQFYFNEIFYKCNSCETEVDILNETEKNYLEAEKKAQINFVKNVLEELNEAEISMAFFERVFELPARTLTRWKNEDFSATTLALLRIIKTYPWIVEVAENRFEPIYAQKKVMHTAIDIFTQDIPRPSIESTLKKEKKSSTSITQGFEILPSQYLENTFCVATR